MNLETLSIDQTRAALTSGETTATALAEVHYARIAQKDGEINSYLSLAKDRALAQAAKIDALAKAGDPLPPLAGVPLGIKDVLTMVGSPATAGSKILEGYHPPYDCTAVAKLEAAGAVLLGKLNCDEFAMGSSNENSAYGPVHNPRALDRVPGGSSGGSAAAVAAGFCVASLGTDTGGSIRQPAAFCGVTGLLPTWGRVSRFGLIAFASSLDRIGPFTRNVKDAATLLGVMAGSDIMDATASHTPVNDYVAESQKPVAGLKIGVPEEYFGEGLDLEIRAAVEKSIADLKAAGCEIKKISLPHTRYAIPTYYVIATAEASSNLSRFDGVRFGLRDKSASTLTGMYRQTRDAGFGAEVKRRILLGTYALSAGYYDAYYKKAQQVRTLLTRDFLSAFADVDAIVTPMTPTPAFKLGEKTDDPVAMYLADVYTVAASLAGICGVSVPCGNTKEGLPIGVQILGRHFDEGMALRVAQAVENAQK
ncbi:Asp-tRNA(Asn)/Glu-tRNA(Gln) amidotransferase subunit GatA [Terriglobus albidus]|uniref:Glutamyl-tRNA(Gln) amidotransferase subunit A n=1 Tax=Terriglobus albidus TaxID=1592106 RepID=A0A5B9EA62_9BACT|nr:Asp-tRNA(Asn)/Glu-tRNA(Gln) amidotransferase subunit GatA [Terriglobus albidus]QEE27321.1 Asp-tRNA(Asn)/Glu-tRNA(Gln) amidotransferase subunit GatA [Terriglobus albidus]